MKILIHLLPPFRLAQFSVMKSIIPMIMPWGNHPGIYAILHKELMHSTARFGIQITTYDNWNPLLVLGSILSGHGVNLLRHVLSLTQFDILVAGMPIQMATAYAYPPSTCIMPQNSHHCSIAPPITLDHTPERPGRSTASSLACATNTRFRPWLYLLPTRQVVELNYLGLDQGERSGAVQYGACVGLFAYPLPVLRGVPCCFIF
mmetsp:Transcript_34467/g.75781  ORF Transcript_34467/g.75781 Transcript_34467/m.75781 type:complete len:204 (-) Transcript_34467:469-1080(-)